jgi:hypothetical protein
MHDEISLTAKEPDLSPARGFPEVRLDGTLYAANGNCDSMSVQATHCHADLKKPIMMPLLHTITYPP